MPICGGNWTNTGNAGVFYVNLNNARSNVNTNIGFRAALPLNARTGKIKIDPAVRGDKGACFHSGSHGIRAGEKLAILVRGYGRARGDKQNGTQLRKPQVALLVWRGGSC